MIFHGSYRADEILNGLWEEGLPWGQGGEEEVEYEDLFQLFAAVIMLCLSSQVYYFNKTFFDLGQDSCRNMLNFLWAEKNFQGTHLA